MTHGGIVANANVPSAAGAITATPGTTMSLDVTTGNYAKWTAGQNETVNLTGAQFVSQELTIIIVNDATLPRTITFGTGFKSIGVVIGATSKTAILKFISDGTNFYELCRTLLLSQTSAPCEAQQGGLSWDSSDSSGASTFSSNADFDNFAVLD